MTFERTLCVWQYVQERTHAIAYRHTRRVNNNPQIFAQNLEDIEKFIMH